MTFQDAWEPSCLLHRPGRVVIGSKTSQVKSSDPVPSLHVSGSGVKRQNIDSVLTLLVPRSVNSFSARLKAELFRRAYGRN